MGFHIGFLIFDYVELQQPRLRTKIRYHAKAQANACLTEMSENLYCRYRASISVSSGSQSTLRFATQRRSVSYNVSAKCIFSSKLQMQQHNIGRPTTLGK